ncbi:uncharacterized protein VTP21DRAFT_1859 [Calcarisporiella thermophila]|uniref:uncharacterized protein n=1 Tax=Calcarisporiella thermophila TaxID=911321 RepID=UPI003742779A
MLQLVSGLNMQRYTPRIYVVSQDDHLSAAKAREFEHSLGSMYGRDYLIRHILRARQVGQPWLTTPWSVLQCMLSAVRIVLGDRPDVLICNGPGSCVPLCVLAYIPRIFGLAYTRLLYVESFARTHSLSLSGRLLIRFVDRFIVQWPSLALKYRRAENAGILV